MDTLIYLLGGKEDTNYCEEIQNEAEHPAIFNLAGSLNLLDSAALMKDAKMNYVNDSGPMHIASAMNANITVYYCSTVPSFGFGPLSDNSIINEVKGLSCKPCGLHGFKNCPKNHFSCGNNLEMEG